MKKVYYKKKTAKPKKSKILKTAYKKHIKPGIQKDSLIYHSTQFLIFFLAISFVFAIAQGILMYFGYVELKQAHERVVLDYKYWEKVIEEHPDFPDGLYNAAIYAGKLGDRDKAIELIQRAITLDPEFVDAKELEEKILEE